MSCGANGPVCQVPGVIDCLVVRTSIKCMHTTHTTTGLSRSRPIAVVLQAMAGLPSPLIFHFAKHNHQPRHTSSCPIEWDPHPINRNDASPVRLKNLCQSVIFHHGWIVFLVFTHGLIHHTKKKENPSNNAIHTGPSVEQPGRGQWHTQCHKTHLHQPNYWLIDAGMLEPLDFLFFCSNYFRHWDHQLNERQDRKNAHHIRHKFLITHNLLFIVLYEPALKLVDLFRIPNSTKWAMDHNFADLFHNYALMVVLSWAALFHSGYTNTGLFGSHCDFWRNCMIFRENFTPTEPSVQTSVPPYTRMSDERSIGHARATFFVRQAGMFGCMGVPIVYAIGAQGGDFIMTTLGQTLRDEFMAENNTFLWRIDKATVTNNECGLWLQKLIKFHKNVRRISQKLHKKFTKFKIFFQN